VTAGVVTEVPPDLSSPPDQCPIALCGLAIGSRLEVPPFLTVFREQGCTIIAYGSESTHWPLASKARMLLQGVTEILDSSDPAFPVRLGRLIDSQLAASRRRHEEFTRIGDLKRGLGIVAESRAMVDVLRSVLRAGALSDLPVLITGETGTGKELLAQAIHRLDNRRHHRPLVPINCGAISPTLAESEMFGHRRGAFTGADRDRKGLVRAADGGILFLDEIGDLELGLQGKLLRVLQEGRVLGVGDDAEIAVDVRVVAATNRNLAAMVDAGTFRADLLHRLSVFTLTVPPLRDRPGDIRPLLEHFLAKHSALFGQEVPEVASEVVEALGRLQLEGNAREVENLVRHALACRRTDGPLQLVDLPPQTWRQLAGEGSVGPMHAGAGPLETPIATPGAFLRAHHWSLVDSLGDCERVLLEAALELAEGNQAGAARLLGITPRSVYNKIRRHHLRSLRNQHSGTPGQ
jgi:transcriptional regulator with GAF, ATPase, and Fis domain